ncbi:MAG: polysaccharide pyruvyl transferase family protein, partial [Bacteroidaceae bacterium]
ISTKVIRKVYIFDMKKIGLSVVIYKDNFGSALQTFATQYVVSKLGFDAECIDTTDIQATIDAKKKKYYLRRVFNKEELKYLFSFISSMFRKKMQSAAYANNMIIRHEQYTKFNDNFLKLSRRVNSFEDLTELSKSYDALIVGSDQLWRPSNIAGCYFTLEFAAPGVKKIAYSTSFGVAKLHKSIRKHAKSFLCGFDWISVRENSGKTIVKEMIDRDVPVVCDPTMLLTIEEWCQNVSPEPIVNGDYILCYIMGESKEQRGFVKQLSKGTGCKVVGLLHGSTYVAGDDGWVDEAPYNIGPFEFINLIKHAKYVCTDSFHCCVFSILNNTSFFVFRRDADNEETSANDRIYTLLSWSGIYDRLIYGTESIDEQLTKSINFEDVNKKVEQRRADSMEYLTNALKTV